MTTRSLSNLRLGDQEFVDFADLVASRSGMELGPSHRRLLETRLGPHLAGESASAYLARLRLAGPEAEEWLRFVDLLVVGETSFFRTPAQFDVVRDVVVPEMLGRGIRPIRFWSAGCSTGPEPYTLVLLLTEAGYRIGEDADILAADISSQALAAAREGLYNERALRRTPEVLRDRYFVPEGAAYRLQADVRRHVRFDRVNLAHDDFPAGRDVIFCRNVLIYFPADVRRRILERFHRALRPGGYCFVGPSETLRDQADLFERLWAGDTVYFRRREPGAVQAEATGRPPPTDTTTTAPRQSPMTRIRRRRVQPSVHAGDRDIRVLEVSGVLDFTALPAIGENLQARLGELLRERPSRAILNLTGVRFLDGRAAGTLRRAVRALEDEGARVAIVTRDPQVMRWLRKRGPNTLAFHPTETAARESLVSGESVP